MTDKDISSEFLKILKKQDLNFFKDGKVGDFLLSLHTMNALILVPILTVKELY